jgi:hypothetical protein
MFTNSSPQASAYRPLEYTLFSSKYFISRPTPGDLIDFLDEIVENSSQLKGTEPYESWKFGLVYSAKGDYYELIARIKDTITRFENTAPVIELVDLTRLQLLGARFQKCLAVVFESTFKMTGPSFWKENEEILKWLYDTAAGVMVGEIGHDFSDNNTDSKQGAVSREFYAMLSRVGIFSTMRRNEHVVGAKRINICGYKLTDQIPDSIPDRRDFINEAEQGFIEAMKELAGLLVKFQWFASWLKSENADLNLEAFLKQPSANLKVMAEWGLDQTFFRHYPTFQQLTGSAPPPYPFDEMSQWTKEVKGSYTRIQSQSNTVFANMIRMVFPSLKLQGEDLSRNQALIEATPEQLRISLQNRSHHLLYVPNLSRRVITIFDPPEDYLEKHSTELASVIDSQRLLVTTAKPLRGTKTKGTIVVPLMGDEYKAVEKGLKELGSWLQN